MWEFGNVNLESPDCRVRGPGLEETPGPQLATVAVAARPSFRRRIVAAQRQAVVGAEGKAAADDVGLREAEERREHFERAPFDAGSRREGRDLLERAKVFRPAVRITGVIERVDADDDGFGADDLGPGRRERQEDRVAGGHVGGRNARRVERAILRDVAVADECRAANRRQRDVQLEMTRHAERGGDTPCSFDLADVHLSVANRQYVPVVPVGRRHRAGRIRVETATQQQHRAFHRSSLVVIERSREHAPGALDKRPPYTPRTSAPHMYLCAWSCSRTGRRSARIQAASSRALMTPWTGENSTAAAFDTRSWLATTSRANS